MLVAITGYDAVSLQPNAGSQGELAGLLAIRAYHRSRGDDRRTVCLIPSQRARHQRRQRGDGRPGAWWSWPATTTATSTSTDLRAKADGCRPRAWPRPWSPTRRPTGCSRRASRELCAIVHDHGGQVYVDGANLNALVGIAQPGRFGADVSHLNLHKTFCIPHGGGGPGVGPVAVRAHLAPFLPGHPLAPARAARSVRCRRRRSGRPASWPSRGCTSR